MSWEQVEIEVGGKTFSGHVMIGDEATVFNIPPASGLEEGGKFGVAAKHTPPQAFTMLPRGAKNFW